MKQNCILLKNIKLFQKVLKSNSPPSCISAKTVSNSMDPRFYQKIEIFEIQNFNKIPSFTISFFIFLAFLAFYFLFHLPKLVQNLWIFLWCFIRRVRDFTNDFWKILKVLLKKILICEFVFSKFCGLLFVFLFFLLFLTFYFQLRLSILGKKF